MSPTIAQSTENDESLHLVLKNVLGVIVSDVQRSHLVEKMESLLFQCEFDSLALLVEKLQSGDVEVRAKVLDVISQRLPDWSLHGEVKNILHKHLFPQLSDKAKIWIAGSGQGQLAYLIMMEIAKYEKKTAANKNFTLLATDVLANDINHAEKATYNLQQLATLHDENRKRFFTVDEKTGSGQIKNEFRQTITFSQCDLTENFQSLGAMDLIICPQVLMYFSKAVKAEIFSQFSDSLKDGGFLLTGDKQSVALLANRFEVVEHPAGVFYRKKTNSPSEVT